MSDHSPPTTPGTGGRRASLTEMFMPRTANTSQASSYSTPSSVSLSSHVGTNAQNHRRGMSITTLGLTGTSPNQSSPMTAFNKPRRASTTSSSVSGSPEFRHGFEDKTVVEEEESTDLPAITPTAPSFARRMSFGAQALRDVRVSGNAPGGDSFNWSENLRDRNKRQTSTYSTSDNPFSQRQRATSVAFVEPPQEVPKAQAPPSVQQPNRPDQLGERMLRGDFMMD